MKLKETWDKLPDIAKIIVVIIGVIIVYRIFTFLKTYTKTLHDGAQSNAEEKAFKAAGDEASYSDAEFANMADRIETAFKGGGTDPEVFFAVISLLNNNLDALKLNQAFGVRSYTTWYGGTETATLEEWIEGDLSSSEMARMNSILSTNGITYRFK